MVPKTGSCLTDLSGNVCSRTPGNICHFKLGHIHTEPVESQLGAYFTRHLWAAAAPASRAFIDFARR